jgi:NADPH:quinone reductase-like Zn-dependent oxidoreductase
LQTYWLEYRKLFLKRLDQTNLGGELVKAIIFPKYGSPDVLQLVEVEKPAPNENQVLIKVVAASANPLDWHRMRGEPFIARMGEGLRKPQDTRLGADVAGRVEAVGKNITGFKPGDEVFGAIGQAALPSTPALTKKIWS